jgi:hypothetical protein
MIERCVVHRCQERPTKQRLLGVPRGYHSNGMPSGSFALLRVPLCSAHAEWLEEASFKPNPAHPDAALYRVDDI